MPTPLPETSVGYLILEDLQAILQRAGLAGIDPMEIKIRELPKKGETIDRTPCVFLCPYHKIEPDPLALEGGLGHKHRVEVCLIDATEGEFGVDQRKRQTWHEQALHAIEMTDDGTDYRLDLPHVPSVWNIEIEEAPTFDRSKLADLYSYQSIVTAVSTS